VQLVEPVFHVAKGARQAEAALGQVEACIQHVLVLLALVDARQLIVPRITSRQETGEGRESITSSRRTAKVRSQTNILRTTKKVRPYKIETEVSYVRLPANAANVEFANRRPYGTIAVCD
jgi:hypothetical protein